MKECKNCGENKPLDEYYVTSNPGKALRNDCKTCVRAYTAVHYRENKEQHLANQRLRRQRAKNRG